MHELANRERPPEVADETAILRNLFAYAPVAYQVFDRSGRSVAVNRAFVALFGREPPEGYNLFRSKLLEAAGIAPLLRRAFEGETVHVPRFWFDPREAGDAPERRRIALELTLFPLSSGSGSTQHLGVCFKDVTGEMELLRADAALREREERMSALLTSLGHGLIATDTAGLVTWMNPAAETLTGWSLAEAELCPIDAVFRVQGEQTGLPIANPVQEVLERGVVFSPADPTVLVARDGSERTIADSGAPIRDRQGRLRGVVMVFRDVTAERELERERERLFREREALIARLQAVLQRMPIACFLNDENFRVTYVNPAGERMCGYSASELAGQHAFGPLLPARALPVVEQLFARVAGGDAVPSIVGEILTKAGREIVGDWHHTALYDSEGRFVGMITMGVDITERARAQAALRRSEERYRSLVEATSSLVFSAGPDGSFVTPQPQWQAYTGQSWEECRDHALAAAVHPDDLEHVRAGWDRARQNRTGYVVDCRLRHAASGRYRHVIVRCAPLFEASGEIREWIGTVRDVDDRRRAIEELARLEAQNRQAQEANRLKSEFLANMSHELRTPLNAIIGFAELILDKVVEPGSPQHEEFVGLILTSGRHLLDLINDVLDLTKVEAGKLEFHPEPVSIPQVVDEVCAILHAQAVQKGIAVGRELASALTGVVIDPSRFKQVLYNYLSNALKFTGKGGHVTVRARAEGEDSFRIEVEDDGEGISHEDQRRLFVEFQQLDHGSAKRHGGTGLGLALTKRLVEAQGGAVGLESAPGRGSTFYAVLPIRPRACPNFLRSDGPPGEPKPA